MSKYTWGSRKKWRKQYKNETNNSDADVYGLSFYELFFLIIPNPHISKHSEMKANAITDLHRSE